MTSRVEWLVTNILLQTASSTSRIIVRLTGHLYAEQLMLLTVTPNDRCTLPILYRGSAICTAARCGIAVPIRERIDYLLWGGASEASV
jgi:hypothetical protein